MPNPIRRRRLGGSPYPMLATQLVNASSQFWSIADNAALSMGTGVDMTAAGWVYFNSFVGTNPNLMVKYAASGFREYRIELTVTASVGNLTWTASPNGTTAAGHTSSTALVAGQWYFVAVRYDGSNLSSSINNAVLQNTVYSGDIFDGTQQLTFGSNDGAGGSFLNGLLDSWGIWKSARGSGGALTVAQISALYNGGLGLAFRDLPASLTSGLVAWWNFDGTGNDSQGTNHLTNNNGCTFVAGKR